MIRSFRKRQEPSTRAPAQIHWKHSGYTPVLIRVSRQPRGLTLDPKKKTVIVGDKYLNSVMTFSLPELFDRPATSQTAQR
jgi:hypothetical protein